jgi:hypothetical protein
MQIANSFIALIEIWTKIPLSFTHVSSWNNSFRTNVCLGKPDLKPWISKTKKTINLQSIKFKEFHKLEVKHSFLFLTVSSPRPWYALSHSSNFLENTLTCVVFEYGSPEGYTISNSIEADIIMWVHNFHCLFTGILSRKIDIKCKMKLLFIVLYGRYMMWCYIRDLL